MIRAVFRWINRVRLGVCSALLAVLTGCATPPLAIEEQAQGSELTPVVVPTSAFAIQTLQPRRVNTVHLRVYIEGDGRAWITPYSPSLDPTPTQSLALRLALADHTPSAYLARPCQYVKSAGCQPAVWTGERFNQAAVRSLSEALDALKAKFSVTSFELVGHSGGGAMALLLAAQRNDIAQVQTLAGNVDPQAWTELKQLTPLDGLNPADFAAQLKGVPQRHFIGQQDRVVPAGVIQAYRRKVQPRCIEVVTTVADHMTGYDAAWNQQKDAPIQCSR